MYQIFGSKLRLSEEIASQNTEILKSCRVVILQHLLDDTAEWILHVMKNGCTVDRVIGKNYSTNKGVVEKLQSVGIIVAEVGRDGVRKQDDFLRSVVIESLQKARVFGQRTIIHEVGGYFENVLKQIPHELLPYLAGVVEDTTFGHEKYKASDLNVPVFSVARSKLKETEAIFVGESVVTAFNQIMREVGLSVQGREALVVGYGMIGNNLARYLRKNNLHTTVYDIDSVALLHAYMDGHKVIPDKRQLSKFDVIFGAVGGQALSVNDMLRLKNGVVLASAGSGDVEFDIHGLRQRSTGVDVLTESIAVYKLGDKKITLLRSGTPINFLIESVPSEIIDIVYAEILTALVTLLRRDCKIGLHSIPHDVRKQLARRWIELVGGFNESP